MKAHALRKERCGRAFHVVRLIKDDALKRREHGSPLPPCTGASNRQIAKNKMVICHEYLGSRRGASRFEDKTRFSIRAACHRTGVNFTVHATPQLVRDKKREIAPASGRSCLRPGDQRINIVTTGKQGVLVSLFAKATRADIVPATFHQRGWHGSSERALDRFKVAIDKLLLQIDRCRRDHDSFVVFHRPRDRRNEIRKRLADAGSRLGNHDPVLIEPLYHRA